MVNRICAVSAIFLALGPGCRPPPAAPQPPPDECPELGCGLNGAWLGRNVPFRELDLGKPHEPSTRQPNERGLKIEAFEDRDGNALEIDVVGDELIGRIGQDEARGDRLVQSVIRLVTSKEPVERYALTIERVIPTSFWTDAADELLLYEITFAKEGSTKRESVCKPLTDLDPTTAAPERIDGKVIVFRGDRYKDRGYAVSDEPATTWVNLACAGTAIAKLHLLRHTAASRRPAATSADRRTTTLAQRQAILRMLTADYCGVGHPFTVEGHPLSYRFHQAWGPLHDAGFDVRTASIDALWKDTGAVCVGTPRLSDRERRDALLRRIEARCGRRLARCAPPPHATVGDLDVNALLATTGSYAISVNPPPTRPTRP
jgi:hypothetical protein